MTEPVLLKRPEMEHEWEPGPLARCIPTKYDKRDRERRDRWI